LGCALGDADVFGDVAKPDVACVGEAQENLGVVGEEGAGLGFFCECRDIECHALVSLTLLEFDAHRAASPPVPIVATHEDANPAVHIERRDCRVELTVGSAASGA
jgi:hypothetical protein